MQRAKTFFYVCAGLLLLAVSYHLGAISTRAQVVTRELVVTDGAGKHRVSVGYDVGGPYVSFWDSAGYPTVKLTGGSDRVAEHGPYGGYLTFYDSAHRSRAYIGFRQDNGVDGWPVKSDTPGFQLTDATGRKTWSTGGDAGTYLLP